MNRASVQPKGDAATVEACLKQLGLTLPVPPDPMGTYCRGVVRQGVGFLSGQMPVRDGKALYTGLLGRDLDIGQGREAARAAALNILGQLDRLLGGFENLVGLLRLDGFVASAPGFTEQPAVLDGASDLLVHVLGARGMHARSACGVSVLPLNAPLELLVTFAVKT